MDGPDAQPLRAQMRAALTRAIKSRDAAATRALRSVLAAVDNAEAADPSVAPQQQPGRIAGGVAGLGAGEVSRRSITEEDVQDILAAAIAEREAAAAQYAELHREDAAQRLREEVVVLRAL
jgi:uncharacterized protein YqeY